MKLRKPPGYESTPWVSEAPMYPKAHEVDLLYLAIKTPSHAGEKPQFSLVKNPHTRERIERVDSLGVKVDYIVQQPPKPIDVKSKKGKSLGEDWL